MAAATKGKPSQRLKSLAAGRQALVTIELHVAGVGDGDGFVVIDTGTETTVGSAIVLRSRGFTYAVGNCVVEEL